MKVERREGHHRQLALRLISIEALCNAKSTSIGNVQRTVTSTLEFLTAEAAVNRWRKLPANEQAYAALSLVTGEVFQPSEIELIRFA
jgi:hypothetical protein